MLNNLFGLGASEEDLEQMKEMEQNPAIEPGMDTQSNESDQALKKFIQERLNRQQKYRPEPNKNMNMVVGKGKQL